jgi:hypothetical protein
METLAGAYCIGALASRNRMPQLDWSEYAFIECFEVLPAVEEHATEHRFQVVQSDLTLVVTLWQFESVVAIEVTRTESGTPLIAFALVIRGGARHLKGPGTECIEFADAVVVPNRFSYLEYQQKRVDVYDAKQMPGLDSVRVFVKPGIRIEIPRHPRPL